MESKKFKIHFITVKELISNNGKLIKAIKKKEYKFGKISQ